VTRPLYHPSTEHLAVGDTVAHRLWNTDDGAGELMGRVESIHRAPTHYAFVMLSWLCEYFPGHPEGEYRPGGRRQQVFTLTGLVRIERPPHAGDAVRLAEPDSKMPELEVGAIGVIGGTVGPVEEASFTFNATTYRDDRVVVCSGGPATIETSICELTPTGETETLTVWQFRGDHRGTGNGVNRELVVPLWDWRPKL
jgi:hypothetical protein